MPAAPTRAPHSSGRAATVAPARCPGHEPCRRVLDPVHKRDCAPCKGRAAHKDAFRPLAYRPACRRALRPPQADGAARRRGTLIGRPAARASTGVPPSLVHLMREPYTSEAPAAQRAAAPATPRPRPLCLPSCPGPGPRVTILDLKHANTGSFKAAAAQGKRCTLSKAYLACPAHDTTAPA